MGDIYIYIYFTVVHLRPKGNILVFVVIGNCVLCGSILLIIRQSLNNYFSFVCVSV